MVLQIALRLVCNSILIACATAACVLAPKLVAQPLPGTQLLKADGDLPSKMLEGIDRYLVRRTAESAIGRDRAWSRNYSSRSSYEASVSVNRERFLHLIGVTDPRISFQSPSLVSTLDEPALVGEAPGYKIYGVRWPVLSSVDNTLYAEGLLLEPTGTPVARVIAIPDADWSPEMIAGLGPGVPAAAQFARRLAENGCLVLVPVVLSRRPVGVLKGISKPPNNQTHREFVYRMAFEMGRHVIGYEIQKVLAAVDWFTRSEPVRPVGVFGYGEGALLALYSAASDTRIDAAVVSGYFTSREDLWREPVYRNVWALLKEFGDAEIASLIAPRQLIVEAARGPEIGSPPLDEKRRASPGRITSPNLVDVKKEFALAKTVFQRLGVENNLTLVTSEQNAHHPGSDATVGRFLSALGAQRPLAQPGHAVTERRQKFSPEEQERRQFEEMVNFVQSSVQHADAIRRRFWTNADLSSLEKWEGSAPAYRSYLWEEVLGKLPPPTEPAVTHTRLVYDEPQWRGYEVVLPLWPDVFAYGWPAVPKDLKPGERRPVVVCQHGRGTRARDMLVPSTPQVEAIYKRFASRLAERGFITFAPQGPFIFEERYRNIQRKANPLKLSLFSFVLSQHERILSWLETLSFVDSNRIGFYGLSYGGKTAVRVPPLLEKYALSICSGDFTEYTGKMANIYRSDVFMFSIEHEAFEFGLGSTFNYNDLVKLMAPRPFMVERGHRDGVGLDEWVAYEYAKVRRFYTLLGIPDRTTIEFFSGRHEINAAGSFEFLHKHLNWPRPAPTDSQVDAETSP